MENITQFSVLSVLIAEIWTQPAAETDPQDALVLNEGGCSERAKPKPGESNRGMPEKAVRSSMHFVQTRCGMGYEQRMRLMQAAHRLSFSLGIVRNGRRSS